jgi:hypothetical protein
MKIRELMMADDIMLIVGQEVERIKVNPDRDERDLMKLEKLARVYTIMMASTRENLKQGVFGKIDDAELESLDDAEQLDSGLNDTEEAE